MNKNIFLIFIFFKIIITNQLFSQETKTDGIIIHNELTFIIKSPHNWVVDAKSLAYNEEEPGLLFYETSENFNLHDIDVPIIWVNAYSITDEEKNDFSIFVENIFEDFKNLGAEIEKVEIKYDDLSGIYFTYDVIFIGSNRVYCDRIVYARFDNTCLVIGLNTNDLQKRIDLFVKLEELINNIKVLN